MHTALTRPVSLALACLLLVLPAIAAAGVIIEFTGTVTSITGDEDFFAVPNAGVGSSLTGVIEYEPVPDTVYDPIPGDCSMGYVFHDGTMTITIANYRWVYNALAVLLDDCLSTDTVEFIGQGALTYPISAPAHQLFLKLFDQVAPYEILSGLDVPLTTEDLALDAVTRKTGRIYNFTYGELRFDVDSVQMTGLVANDEQTWDSLKALFR